MASIVIVGAGGFGTEVVQWARDASAGGPHTIAGFLDDDPGALEAHGLEGKLLGSPRDYDPRPDNEFVLAVGNPITRRKLADTLGERGARFRTVVHPTAYVAPSAKLGAGTLLCPFAYVGPQVVLGEHVVLNIYASAGHEAEVGACSVLSPYATLNGAARLDDEVFLGTGAVITFGRRVGRRAKVGAGSVVYHEVPPDSLALGNPAKARELPKATK